MRHIAIPVVALLAACSAAATPVGGDGPAVEALTVTPDSAAIDEGDSLDFQARAQLTGGGSAAVPVVWSADGGTVSPAGRFLAGNVPGDYQVVARTTDQQVTGLSLVTVRRRPVTLTRVTLSPDSAVLDPLGVQVFTATAGYSNGTTAPIAPTWTATGGSVTNGTYTAGSSAGTYRVIAASAGKADTARIIVRDTTTPPPPPPPPPPGGGTVLLTEGFDNAAVSGRGWYDNTSPAIVASGARTGGGALEFAFPQGGIKATKGGALRHKFPGTDRVYVRYWVRYSANWVGSGKSYHPHEFHVVTDQDGDWIGPSASHLTTYIEHNWQQGGIPRLAITDALNIDVTRIGQNLSLVTENRAAAGCNGNTDGYPTGCYQSGLEWRNEKTFKAPQPAFTPATQASWHMVEAYFELNTIVAGKGMSDGIARYWYDGQLVIDKSDVLFRTAARATMKFNQFIIAPYIGDGAPVAETMWVDDLVVATGRVP